MHKYKYTLKQKRADISFNLTDLNLMSAGIAHDYDIGEMADGHLDIYTVPKNKHNAKAVIQNISNCRKVITEDKSFRVVKVS